MALTGGCGSSGRDLQQSAGEFLDYPDRQLLVLREFWTSCYGFLATDSGPLSVVPVADQVYDDRQ